MELKTFTEMFSDKNALDIKTMKPGYVMKVVYPICCGVDVHKTFQQSSRQSKLKESAI